VHPDTDALFVCCLLASVSQVDGTTALFVACQNGHADVVRALVDAGASVTQPKVRAGVLVCDVLSVPLALFSSAMVRRQALMNHPLPHPGSLVVQTNGWTPLRIAQKRGLAAIVAIMETTASAGHQAACGSSIMVGPH
jgi:ankyrin repeat protein